MQSPGVYLLYRSGWLAYVGRADFDVESRARASIRQGPYDRTYEVLPLSSARQAYLEECRLFHRHAPADNLRHPAVPRRMNWRCPVKGCCWS